MIYRGDDILPEQYMYIVMMHLSSYVQHIAMALLCWSDIS